MWDALVESVKETASSPVDLILLGVIGFVVYRMIRGRFGGNEAAAPPPVKELPPLPKGDLSLAELKAFDGSNDEGRILMGVDGVIFDVSRASRMYGKDGPYGLFAGRDASRGLATFEINTNAVKDDYDDISDLGAYEMDSLQEWKRQFMEKYDVVGKLLKPGDVPTDYSKVPSEKSE